MARELIVPQGWHPPGEGQFGQFESHQQALQKNYRNVAGRTLAISAVAPDLQIIFGLGETDAPSSDDTHPMEVFTKAAQLAYLTGEASEDDAAATQEFLSKVFDENVTLGQLRKNYALPPNRDPDGTLAKRTSLHRNASRLVDRVKDKMTAAEREQVEKALSLSDFDLVMQIIQHAIERIESGEELEDLEVPSFHGPY